MNNFNAVAPKPLSKSSLDLIAHMNPDMSEENALTLTQSILEVVGEWPCGILFLNDIFCLFINKAVEDAVNVMNLYK